MTEQLSDAQFAALMRSERGDPEPPPKLVKSSANYTDIRGMAREVWMWMKRNRTVHAVLQDRVNLDLLLQQLEICSKGYSMRMKRDTPSSPDAYQFMDTDRTGQVLLYSRAETGMPEAEVNELVLLDPDLSLG